jgi:hypothetical protein
MRGIDNSIENAHDGSTGQAPGLALPGAFLSHPSDPTAPRSRSRDFNRQSGGYLDEPPPFDPDHHLVLDASYEDLFLARGHRMPIADHIWPALYPGIIIGALYGLSLRGVWNFVLGAAGGIAGAAISLPVVAQLGLNEGFVSLVVLIALSFVGAFAFTRFTSVIKRP